MKRLAAVLALAAALLVGAPQQAEAWSFDVDGECVLAVEEGGRYVVFTIDNTGEREALTIIDQDPDSGITSVAARSTAEWSVFVPFDDPRAGATWEVLGNWPSDQRPRHRVASVRFELECPYVPPTTTTTTSSSTTTTSTSTTTTSSTTTLPTTTTSEATTTTTDPTTTSSSSSVPETTTTTVPCDVTGECLPVTGGDIPPWLIFAGAIAMFVGAGLVWVAKGDKL